MRMRQLFYLIPLPPPIQVDVDYLCAARAALRAGACFTALVCTEYHCERQCGTLRLPPPAPCPSPSPSAPETDDPHQLLMEVTAPVYSPHRV
jgi:hypothetical protein